MVTVDKDQKWHDSSTGQFTTKPAKSVGIIDNVEGLFSGQDEPTDRLPDGTREWRKNGKLHREDGPARIRPDGTEEWYKNGKPHRADGPAVIAPDSRGWYKNGKLHREDGPAIEGSDGSQRWYVNNKLHREDGPAIEDPDGSQWWYINNKLHREDGPAIIERTVRSTGTKTESATVRTAPHTSAPTARKSTISTGNIDAILIQGEPLKSLSSLWQRRDTSPTPAPSGSVIVDSRSIRHISHSSGSLDRQTR